MRRRVIRRLDLDRTDLPAPGHRSIKGAHAHGYAELDGKTIDLTRVDPSFAGAAGAGALVTTVQDLARFLDALFRGRPSVRPLGITMAFALNAEDDPTPLVIPAVQALAAIHR